ncbi:MAG TPA: UpxY family transcription antiterminator [Candidatus Dormibacteraeota bacterium]|nr:UpxY family transcription antiterminator [Candidatus Dormibacteraeota bacterium]
MEIVATSTNLHHQYPTNASVGDVFCLWYALWTRSRHEAVVREQLRRKEIEVFLPTVERWSRWKNRRKKIEWPLFPGYCFARFRTDQSLAILTTVGVVAIVSFRGKPAPVAEEEVDALRRVMDTQVAYDPCPLTKEGCLVEVINGPLTGVIGRLVQKDTQQPAVILGVELINQGVRVRVHPADVRPV